MMNVTLLKLSENVIKYCARRYTYQAPSFKTKKLKRFIPSLEASGKSSICEVTENKIDDLTIAAAMQRHHYKAMNPGPGKFSLMKIHNELLNNYTNAYIFPKKIKIGKTRLLTMRQLDHVLSATSLIICAPLAYLYYVKL